MAEQKGGAEDAEESLGEFVGLRNVDDSGIESGEDLRGVNPAVMKEVEDALGRLEGIIHGLDPSRRDAVTKLVSSLQSCLKIPPQKRRATVGVSAEELAEARKWLIPPLEEMVIEHVTYRPLAQRPGYLMEPAPQNAVLSYAPKTERSFSESGSLEDYDPSLILFTPEQTVQIAIHKAAIKKQISQEEKRRESSDDGDVSSADEENSEINKYNEVSSAQRLLQIATESAKKNPSAARFHNRSSKKLKMKRANTIDIPKPSNFYEYSSGDEYGASADEVNTGLERRRSSKEASLLPPSFEPKTENDLKFLAFLKQVNDNQPKLQTYNPSARGGKHWSNRFSSIKTAFEQPEQKQSAAPSPAKMFWQNSESRSNSAKDQPYKTKLPWTMKTENDGVVIGSLTVSKPGHVNNFNHAPKSAFKPIEKKPTSTVSGTVKQIAAQKFSITPAEVVTKPEKLSNKTLSNIVHPLPNNPSKQTNYTAYKHPTPTPSESIHSNSRNHIPYQNYTNVKTSKNVETLGNKFSQVHNGSENLVTNLPDPPNKTKSNINYNSAKNNTEYISKAQYNTMAAKKKFLESSANRLSQDNSSRPDSFVQSQSSDSRPIYNNTNVNGSSKYDDSTVYNGNYHYEHRKSYPQSNNNYSSNHKLDNNIPNKNNSISRDSNRNIGHYTLVEPVAPSGERVDNLNLYSKVDIVEPIIISRGSDNRSVQRTERVNKTVPDHKDTDQRNYSGYLSGNVEPADMRRVSSPHYQNSSYPTTVVEQSPAQSISYHSPPEVPPRIRLDSSRGSNGKYSEGCDTFYNNQDSHYYPNNTKKHELNDYRNSPNTGNKPYTTYIYSSNNTLNSSNVQDSPNEKSNYTFPTIVPTPPLLKEEPASPPCYIPTPSNLDYSQSKGVSDMRYLSPSYQSISPSPKYEDDDSSWAGSANNGGEDSPLEEKAVSKVMGQAQCQHAVTVNNRTRRRFDVDLESELKLQLKQSAQKKSLSPSFPNVIQKSESWHQMVKEQMQQAKQAPPLPKIAKAKSSHALAQPKQFEAALAPDSVTQKKITVSQYLQKQQARSVKSSKSNPKYKSTNTLNIRYEDDDLDDVDEVFESIFQECSKKRNSK